MNILYHKKDFIVCFSPPDLVGRDAEKLGEIPFYSLAS